MSTTARLDPLILQERVTALLDGYPEASKKAALTKFLEQLTAPAERALPKDGIRLQYPGQSEPWCITWRVRPKTTDTLDEFGKGTPDERQKNLLVEGENLSAMTTLYKYRGQVDLIVTDPPYNTGKDFRYNDHWDDNPDDPFLGANVPEEDSSRHVKWLKFMYPRLYLMYEMLKPQGVLAICIDHRELYRLGCMLDDVFGEENRIAIINWQKSYSPKSDSKHVSTATEYVLVYAKDLAKAKTGLDARGKATDAKYKNPDDDPAGDWRNDNPTAASGDEKAAYAIQSPFTGQLYYPGARYWVYAKKDKKTWLEGWGSAYEEREIEDGLTFVKDGKAQKIKALVLADCQFKDGKVIAGAEAIARAREAALQVLARGQWPKLYWGLKGDSGPQIKRYMSQVKQGKVPMSYWANEDYAQPIELGCTSWAHEESGHSQAGITELSAIVGKGHKFETVKPLKLIKKIIQLWCPAEGIVFDPFAGSGTTGQAVLELNTTAKTERRFILVEQGNSDTGDLYARTLTALRLKRVITGDWESGKVAGTGGGFTYLALGGPAGADTINALKRKEMVDLLSVHYSNSTERARSVLTKVADERAKFCFAKNSRGEGLFLVFGDESGADLTLDIYEKILEEAEAISLAPVYHIYAKRFAIRNSSIRQYQIPDVVLANLGCRANQDSFNAEEV